MKFEVTYSCWVGKCVFSTVNQDNSIIFFPSSIFRVAGVTSSQLQETAASIPVDVTHEKELKLAKCIVRFPEVLCRTLDELFPHLLCDYLYELCTTLTEFYDACYCIEKDKQTGAVVSVNMSRLMLCEATRLVLERAFFILGIDPVGKM